MDKIYTIPEIKAIQEEQKYKFIGLNTHAGKEVIKQNGSTIKPEFQLDKIETRLKAPKFVDGYYVVYCRSHYKSEPDEYTIVKGDVKAMSEPPEKPETPPMPIKRDEVLSYEQALAMHTEISDLKHEVSTLVYERDQVVEELEEAEEFIEELEEEQKTLSETSAGAVPTMIKETIATLIPVLDRHYDLQDSKLQIERGKLLQALQAQQDAGNGAPNTQAPAPAQHGYTILTEEQENKLDDDAFYQYRNWLLGHYYNTDQEAYQALLTKIDQEKKTESNG